MSDESTSPRSPSDPPQLKVQEVVQLHMVYNHNRTWLHTHGLVKYGYPELEIRDIPVFLAQDAAFVLNAVGQFMLDRRVVVKSDEIMQLGDRLLYFKEAEPEDADEADHYEVECLRVTDPPIDSCLCEVCDGEAPDGNLVED